MKKYLVVFLCCCSYILASIGTNNAFNVFTLPLAEKLHTLRGTVALGSTIYGIVNGLASPLIIKSIRKYKFKPVVTTTTVLFCIVTVLFGYIDNVYVYLGLNVIKGILYAFFQSTIVSIIIGNWFKDKTSTVTSIVMAFSGVAGAILSPIFASSLADYGLKFSYYLMAIVQLIFGLPLSLFISFDPSDVHMEPYTKKSKDKNAVTETRKVNIYYRNNPMFVYICIISICTALLCQFASHYTGYAESIGSGEIGAYMVSATMVGNILFKFIIGIICDKYGDDKGSPFICIVCAVGCLMMFVSNNATVTMIASVLLGAAYANQVATGALIRYVYGNKQFGQAYSDQAVSFGLLFLGGTVFGYIYDFFNSYKPVFIIVIIILAITFYLCRKTVQLAEKNRNFDEENI